ncbi:hypothetical protein Tco_0858670 [Tanacetum coccineum]|uniref:Uncharacterized protein n=1 Tax=Tanacetum coccineum TaxID=301880 RepID=A0ABQ5BDT3_9ASTR
MSALPAILTALLLCPLAWDFPARSPQLSATLTQARSTASTWQYWDVSRPNLLAPQTVRDCKDLQWQK